MKLQKKEIKKNEKIVEKPDDDLIIHHGYKVNFFLELFIMISVIVVE